MQSKTLRGLLFVMAVMLAFCMSSCSSGRSNLEGSFGLDSSFTPNTYNIKDVEYKIASIEKDGALQGFAIDWTPLVDGAKPELCQHIVVYDSEGHECKRTYHWPQTLDLELNAERLKAGSVGSYSASYEMSSNSPFYEVVLSNEFGESLASFQYAFDPESGKAYMLT